MSRRQPQQQQRRQAEFALVYSAACPNCWRFIETLAKTSADPAIDKYELSNMHPADIERLQISIVPTLVPLRGGHAMAGTDAFKWLDGFTHELPLDGFEGERGGLTFSDYGQTYGTAAYQTFGTGVEDAHGDKDMSIYQAAMSTR